MTTRTSVFPLGAAAIVAAGAIVALSACEREQAPSTVGQKLDAAVSQAERKVETAKDKIAQGAADAQRDAKEAMHGAADVVGDAAITASVNAKLASDPELSALNIGVDTVSGRVALHGAAPTASARKRATQLASSVSGVRGVDNQLEVKPNG